MTSSSWTTTAAIHHLARAKPTILVDFFVTNIGGAACFVQVHDSVNLPANGVKPRLRIKLPAEAGSFVALSMRVPCTAGVFLVLSDTLDELTLSANTAHFHVNLKH